MCAWESGSHTDTKLRSPKLKKGSPSAWLYACPYFFFLNLFHCHSLSSFLYSLYITLSLLITPKLILSANNPQIYSRKSLCLDFLLLSRFVPSGCFVSFFFNCLSPKPMHTCALVLAYLSHGFPLGPFFPPSPIPWHLDPSPHSLLKGTRKKGRANKTGARHNPHISFLRLCPTSKTDKTRLGGDRRKDKQTQTKPD